jgi:leucyl-tRNA synthetase
MVLAPEHPLVADLTTSEHGPTVAEYRRQAEARKDVDRQDENRAKTGVFTGSYATNPVTGKDIPIWVADYVLMGYGTGAIMAVPCGDQRDFEFAQLFGLDIPAIQQPPDEWFEAQGIAPTLDTRRWREAFVGDAPYVNSSNDTLDLNGMDRVEPAIEATNAWLEEQGAGEGAVTYATGCSAGSATGASRSRSSTTSTAGRTCCPTTTSRWSCRRPTASRPARSTPTTSSPTRRARWTG